MIVPSVRAVSARPHFASHTFLQRLLVATALGCSITPAMAQVVNEQSQDGSPISIDSGDIIAGSGSGGGIAAATTGAILIDSDSVSTVDAGGTAIKASGGTGNVAINSGTIVTAGANAFGIDAVTTGGTITIDSLGVTTTGSGQVYGISAMSGGGAINIESGTVSVSGSGTDNNRGIHANSGGGDIVINAGTTTGYTRGIFTTTLFSGPDLGFTAGNTTITSQSATATGGNAIIAQGRSVSLDSQFAESFANPAFFASTIYVSAGLGGATVVAGETIAHGNGQYAINALATGNLLIRSGTVQTDGPYGVGILAAGNADIEVISATIRTQNTGSTGIRLDGYTTYGPGNWTVQSGRIETAGAESNAIWISPFNANLGTSAAIEVSSDTIQTAGSLSHGIVVAAESNPGYAQRTASATAGTGQLSITSRDLSATGAGSRGIVADHAGPVAITSGSLVADAGGVFVWGRDSVSVTSAQLSTRGGPGIVVYGDTGAVDVTAGSVEVGAQGDVGIYAGTTSGAVTVTADLVQTNGITPASGFAANGIFATSLTGNVAVSAREVSVKGTGASGIVATTGGEARVAATKVSTSGTNGTAIFAGGSLGLTIDASDVSTTGSGGIGIRGRSLNGTVAIKAGSVSTTGSNAPAIFVPTSVNGTAIMGGGISLDLGTITSAGSLSHGVVVSALADPGYAYRTASATAGTGALSIKAASISATGQGARGIVVDHAGATSVESGSIVADTGGIYIWGKNSVSVTSANLFTLGGPGLVVYGDTGNVGIAAGSVEVGAQGDAGIYAGTSSGNISIAAASVKTNGILPASGFTADGIIAESSAGGNIEIDAGEVSVKGTSAFGIYASSAGQVSLAADKVATTGASGTAIFAGGSAGLTIDAGEIATSGDDAIGIRGRSLNGAVSIAANSVQTSGANAPAIYVPTTVNGAATMSGPISISVGSITTSGSGSNGIVVAGSTHPTFGLRAAAGGTGALSIEAGAIGTTGPNAWGVVIDHVGPVDLAVDSISTAGAFGAGVYAWLGGTGNISTGTIDTQNGAGMVVYGSSGDIAVKAGTTKVGAGGDVGIYVRTTSGNITIDATETSTARLDILDNTFTADGVTGVSASGGSVTIAAGSTFVKGQSAWGVTAATSGTARITSESVNTTGESGIGIFARGDTGGATVISRDVTTSGASAHGISAQATSGAISIDSTETVATGGAGATGILGRTAAGSISASLRDVRVTGGAASAVDLASSAGGAISLAVSGLVSASGGTAPVAGALLSTTGAMNVTVASSGSLTGSGSGIVAQQGTLSLANSGTIHSTDGTGILLNVEQGTVTNGGRIEAGAIGIDATGSQLRIANAGTISSAGTSIAANGTATIVNTGSITGNGGVAIDLVSGSGHSVTNTGQIAAADMAVRASGSVTLENAGSLSGNSGVAARLSASADTLVLRTGSAVNGTIFGGAGNDSVVLQGSQSLRIGSQQFGNLAEFETLAVSAGYWTTSGASSIATVEVASGATLEIGADGTASALTFTGLNNSGQVVLAGSNTISLGSAAAITGTGKLLLAGGRLDVSGAGLAQGGGVEVRAGQLSLSGTLASDVSTTGSGVFQLAEGGAFTGNLLNNGTFLYSKAGDYTFSGAFSGNGVLRKEGTGTLTFGGLYAFTGTTTLLGGKVVFAGSLADDTKLGLTSGTVDLSQVEGGVQTIAELSGTGGTVELGETTLIIEQLGNTVFNGSITGMGELIKTGSGDLKLNGDSTFSGTATVDGGILSVNGSMPNANVEVNTGGQLGGNGTVGTTQLNGGVLAPGNSIGRLAVNGNIAFNSASVYAVEVNAAGQNDRTDATGTATLGNAQVQVIGAPGTYKVLTDYTILTASGGLSGRFGSVSDNLAFVDPYLIYSTNAVTLRLVRNDIDFAVAGTTPNERAIANLIEGYGYSNRLYDEALMLVASDAAASFGSLTGEVYPTYGTALVETAEMLRRQTKIADQGGIGPFGWATGLVNRAGTASGLELDGAGVAGGLGFGFGLGSVAAGVGRIDQDGGSLDDGDVTFTTAEIALGAAGVRLEASAQFGWTDGLVSRNPVLGTLAAPVSGRVQGDYSLLSAQVGYDMDVGVLQVAPFVGISRMAMDTEAVTEAGGATALRISADERAVTMGRAGLRLEGAVGPVRAHVAGAYRHAWGDRSQVAEAAFGSAAGTARIVGDAVSRRAAELDAGLTFNAGPVALEAGYSGLIGKDAETHGGKLAVKFRF